MAAEHLLKEIESAKQFFDGRSKVPGAKLGIPTLAASFTSALVAQINAGADYTAEEATKINAALEDCPYGEEGVKTILAAPDSKMHGLAANGQKKRVSIIW